MTTNATPTIPLPPGATLSEVQMELDARIESDTIDAIKAGFVKTLLDVAESYSYRNNADNDSLRRMDALVNAAQVLLDGDLSAVPGTAAYEGGA